MMIEPGAREPGYTHQAPSVPALGALVFLTVLVLAVICSPAPAARRERLPPPPAHGPSATRCDVTYPQRMRVSWRTLSEPK